MQMIPIVFQASLLTLQMAVAALTAVASLMVEVVEDLVPFDSREKKTRIYGFWSFFASPKRSIIEKSASFRYNRKDREIEEKSDVEMDL